jgi:hypothetical protein
MDDTKSFEKALAQSDADLKALCAAGSELVGVIRRAADALTMPAPGDLERLDERRSALLSQQHSSNGRLAGAVAQIAAKVDQERLAFDGREIPLKTDVMLGYLSKRAMRRRIEARAARSGSAERLRIALGRADRLWGVIDSQRQRVILQRSEAEEALAALGAHKAEAIRAVDDGRAEAYASPAQSALAVEQAVGVFVAIVDMLNDAVHDYTVCLHKLTFDTERLLDLYGVLASTVRDRRPFDLSPEAYPHLEQAVVRLVSGHLPGIRLDDSRHRADRAYAERFLKGDRS